MQKLRMVNGMRKQLFLLGKLFNLILQVLALLLMQIVYFLSIKSVQKTDHFIQSLTFYKKVLHLPCGTEVSCSS
jgi:hypothetical protein